jgi:hypothetical protein
MLSKPDVVLDVIRKAASASHRAKANGSTPRGRPSQSGFPFVVHIVGVRCLLLAHLGYISMMISMMTSDVRFCR